MADFMDVGQWRETPSGKNRFVKLGYATEKKGGGYYVHMDALPLPSLNSRSGKIECQVVIQPPKGDYPAGRQQSGANPMIDDGASF